MRELMKFRRLVSGISDLEKLENALHSLIENINAEGDHYFVSFDEEDDPNDHVLWTCMSEIEFQILLKFERHVNLGYVDLLSSSSESLSKVSETLLKSELFEDEDFFLENVSDESDLNERKILQISFASVGELEKTGTISVIDKAIKSDNKDLRRAATFGILSLMWDTTTEMLKKASKIENDDGTKQFMELVLEELESINFNS